MAGVAVTVLTFEEARRRILDGVSALVPIELPLAEAWGCVMARDVITEYDIPPFSSGMVEGFAVRSADVAAASPQAPVQLRVAGSVVAGRPPEITVGWGEAARITAAAPIPAGADTVIPADRAVFEGESVRIEAPAGPREQIRPAGEDIRAGSVLVPAGRRLSAAELGMLATAGYGAALTYPKVRVAVVSIGELIEPGRPAGFGQVRDANSYSIVGGLRDVGAVPYRVGIVQNVESDLRESLLSNLSRADAFICAGGVGEEEGDRVSLVLAGMGELETIRVAMRPGGIMGFGIVDGKPFFSLSSEPASAFVTWEVFVRPAILKTMGRRDLGRPEVSAVLEGDVPGPGGATRFVPTRVSHRQGAWRATPTGEGAPGLLGSVVHANGFMVLPPDDGAKRAGDRVRVQIFRPLER
jgi:molybdenum cofactor synthesis domain-containing protein